MGAPQSMGLAMALVGLCVQERKQEAERLNEKNATDRRVQSDTLSRAALLCFALLLNMA